MSEALNIWQLNDMISEKLPDVDKSNVTRMTTVLWRNGVHDLDLISEIDVNDAIDWYMVGPQMVENFKKLGMKGELPEEEPREPIDRRKLECPICGVAMEVGNRARITIQWEYERTETKWGNRLPRPIQDLVGRSSMVCRDCAAKASRDMGIEIPTEANYVDAGD